MDSLAKLNPKYSALLFLIDFPQVQNIHIE
jgi:hypothetical protein